MKRGTDMDTGTQSRLSPLESTMISREAGSAIAHGFFTRKGGISNGIYAGLNVGQGSSDAPENVSENRRRVAEWFGRSEADLATLYQIHSADVVTVTRAPSSDRPRADGQVTREPGLVLGILTADCGPVLFADAEAGVVGAAHAGWKGALGGVLEATIAAMEGLGARRNRIVATLGPSISQANYEVGPEFIERFVAEDAQFAQFFRPSAKPDHHMFDLPGLTVARLEKAGITADHLDVCTYREEEDFFSYRRTTHRAEPDYGRQISAIMIREK